MGLNIKCNMVPIFCYKVWQLIDDEKNREFVKWSNTGRSFIIINKDKFAKEVLPNYFKHNKINSFIRQLNNFGFKKLTGLQEGSMRYTNNSLEYEHEYFVQGQPELLEKIVKAPRKTKPECSRRRLGSEAEQIPNRPSIMERLQKITRQNDDFTERLSSFLDSIPATSQMSRASSFPNLETLNRIDKEKEIEKQFENSRRLHRNLDRSEYSNQSEPVRIGSKRKSDSINLVNSILKRTNLDGNPIPTKSTHAVTKPIKMNMDEIEKALAKHSRPRF